LGLSLQSVNDGHAIVTCARASVPNLGAVTIPAKPPRRRPPLPQPRREPWSAALAPSQQRAAEARAAVSRQRSAREWLRVIAPR